MLSEQGKSALFAGEGAPSAEAQKLLDGGVSVVGVDLIGQGEFTKDGQPVKNRPVDNPREFAGYTYGYNHSLVAQRVHDVLSVVAFVKNNEQKPKSVEVIATDGTAPAAALALAQCGGAVERAALDTRGFRFLKLTDYLDANFLPGGAKYGDLPGILALAAPADLWLGGETAESAALTKQACAASGCNMELYGGKPDAAAAAALAWILHAK
jgi:hypothetical protein